MKILVSFDGSLNAQVGLRYGIRKVREEGGRLFVLHVFNSSMFIDYGAGPGAEEIARKESSRHIHTAGKIIAEEGSDIETKLITGEGNPEEELADLARAEMIDLIIVPPRHRAVAKKALCPVSIIPGNIIFPVDNTDSCLKVLERVADEAAATSSRVIVLGIVPIHLYSRGEAKEIDRIKKETETASKKVEKLLRKKGIEVKEISRSGYPDEEIVKIADEYPVAMIIIPESGDTVSELAKAANIIIDDSERLKKPVFLAAPERAIG